MSAPVQIMATSSGVEEKINDAFADAHRNSGACDYAPLVKVLAVVGLEIVDGLHAVAASIRMHG